MSVHDAFLKSLTFKGSTSTSRYLPGPPYLVVPGSPAADADLTVDPDSGEVRTRRTIDRERTAEYTLSAIKLGGTETASSASASVSVVIRVVDVNDNAPEFGGGGGGGAAVSVVTIPENTPRGTRRKLPAATDLDGGGRDEDIVYQIVGGNADGAFGLGKFIGYSLDNICVTT